MLYGCAVAVGLGTALLALWVDADLWWFELVSLMFLGLGFLFGLSDRETRLDFDHRLVSQGKGGSVTGGIPFADLVGILATVRTVMVRVEQNSHEVRRFTLGLLVADAAAPLSETLAAMRRDRVTVIRNGHPPGTHGLSPQVEHELQAHLLEVVDYADETAVWQAAEWLAKKLDLPLIDACTSPTALRVPEELDLPLGERLARGLQSIDGTAAYSSVGAPAGATAEWRRGGWTLSWRQSRWFEVLVLVGTALLFPVLGLVLFQDDRGGLWICSAFGFCLLPLALVAARWHGLNQLTLGAKRVIVKRGPFGKQLSPLATDSVEAVRVGGTSVYPLLSLVTDQRVLRILMAPPLARWAKPQIERQLRALYEKKLKLADPRE